MKTKQKYVTKTYKLTRENPGLSLILASRHTQRYPLLYFDEKTGTNRSLRYARNQNSPFMEEQDGNAILEPIVFENGFLTVKKENQVLQKFLELHPGNGRTFVEIDKKRDAQDKINILNEEVDALIEARQLSIDQVVNMSRVLFNKNVSTMTTAELKRDLLVFAKNNPKDFLLILKDPMLQLNATVQGFFDNGFLNLRNNDKEIWFNTPSNKKKMTNIPFGEDPLHMAVSFFQSDEGVDLLKHLKKLSENL
tara:strand:- start:2285 stop:3037 length:753 start_codon:yes stop_codon:yes gene_type:complete